MRLTPFFAPFLAPFLALVLSGCGLVNTLIPPSRSGVGSPTKRSSPASP